MNIVLLEDRNVAQLSPITTARPAYAIQCGSYRLVDLASQLGHATGAIVRPYLRQIQEGDFPELGDELSLEDGLLLINARAVPSVRLREELAKWIQAGKPGIVRQGEVLAAALLPAGTPLPGPETNQTNAENYLASLSLDELLPCELDIPLFVYPHDVVRFHQQILADSLADRLGRESYNEISDGVFAAEGAKLGEHVVTDTREGMILLDQGASVGPHSYLSGPIYMGRGARVIEHGSIKDGVSLAHTTKIGGEVEASIVEPYTNKQHHGFLGHSYLGSWINLGAGTCNSDLKNTYGEVKMEYDGKKVGTGLQFVGSIIGDYSKTAINTGIFTGKTIGVCSMVYGFVTTNVPSYVNYARLFGQVTELPPEVMINTQQRMFLRRNIRQRECDVQLLHDMYEITRRERQLGGEPLSL